MIPLARAGLCINHPEEVVVEMGLNLGCPICGHECIPLAKVLNRTEAPKPSPNDPEEIDFAGQGIS